MQPATRYIATPEADAALSRVLYEWGAIIYCDHKSDQRLTFATPNLHTDNETEIPDYYMLTWPGEKDIQNACRLLKTADAGLPCIEMYIGTHKSDFVFPYENRVEMFVVFQLYYDEHNDQLKFHVKPPYTPHLYPYYTALLRSKIFTLRLHVLLGALVTNVLPVLERPEASSEIWDELVTSMQYRVARDIEIEEEDEQQKIVMEWFKTFRPDVVISKLRDYLYYHTPNLCSLVPVCDSSDSRDAYIHTCFETACRNVGESMRAHRDTKPSSIPDTGCA